jgi:hypothetical protein
VVVSLVAKPRPEGLLEKLQVRYDEFYEGKNQD